MRRAGIPIWVGLTLAALVFGLGAGDAVARGRSTFAHATRSAGEALYRALVVPLRARLAGDSLGPPATARSAVPQGIGALDCVASLRWEDEQVRSQWRLPDSCAGRTARLLRIATDSSMMVVDQRSIDASGAVALSDSGAPAFETVGYVLEVTWNGQRRRSSSVDLMTGPRRAPRMAERVWLGATTPDLEVQLELRRSERVRIVVYDLAGRRVGWREEVWLGAGSRVLRVPLLQTLGPGVYLVRVEVGSRAHVVRFSVVR